MTLRPNTSPCTIGDVCDFESGNGFKPQDWKTKGLPIIRIQNLNGSDSFNYFEGEPDPSWIVEPNDLLFAWAGVKGVSFGPTIWNGPKGVLNQHIYRIRPKKGINKRWLYYALLEVTAEIESKAHGFKTSLVHVRKADITHARISLPGEHEQDAVATALGCWDDAIQKTEQLIAAKEQATKGLMQQVFAERSYPRRRLSEFTRRVTRKNVSGDGQPLTISGAHGLVSQSRYFDKRIAAEKTEHYTLLRRGEFAYNKSYSAGYPLGAIKRLDAHEEGIVSTLYLCFALDGKDAPLSDYFAYFCEAGGFNHQIYQVAQEGARNHGLLNVTADDFFSMSMPVPPRDVQERVVNVLGTSMREITLLRDQLAALKMQKRGLMQKLLTGQWRLPVQEEAN